MLAPLLQNLDESEAAELRLHWVEFEPGVGAELRLHWVEFEPNVQTQPAAANALLQSGGGRQASTKRANPHQGPAHGRRINQINVGAELAPDQQIIRAIVAMVTSGALDAMTAE